MDTQLIILAQHQNEYERLNALELREVALIAEARGILEVDSYTKEELINLILGVF